MTEPQSEYERGRADGWKAAFAVVLALLRFVTKCYVAEGDRRAVALLTSLQKAVDDLE